MYKFSHTLLKAINSKVHTSQLSSISFRSFQEVATITVKVIGNPVTESAFLIM